MKMHRAAQVLAAGGVIAYPTEGVYGLGCLPGKHRAVCRVLDIKQRPASKGLILIAATAAQLDDWVYAEELPAADPRQPITWIARARAGVSALLRGEHEGLAVRLTTNPIARALCLAAGSALVSTSANISGHPPSRNRYVLQRQFSSLVNYVVPGDCGPASGPSEIRELGSNRILRPATP